MSSSKEKLNIPALRTVEELLSELGFLKYSTHTRNVTYQLQLLDFLTAVLDRCDVYGGIRNSLIRQLTIITVNIVEYLLFVSLRQVYGSDPKYGGLPDLIGQARKRELLDKSLAGDLNEVVSWRNKLHPSKQKHELDVKSFTEDNINHSNSVLHRLISALRTFFAPRDMQVETETQKCPYEAYHVMYFLDGEKCPCCCEYGY